MLFIALFGTSVLLSATEARKHLTGTYNFVGVRSCTLSSTPFNNDPSGAPTLISGTVTRQTAVDTGTFLFKPDGTGTQSGRSSTMDISTTTVGDSIYSISEFSAPFTFVVNPNNTLDIQFSEGTFSVVLGGGTGNTGTTSPRSEHDVLISPSGFIAGPSTVTEQETVKREYARRGFSHAVSAVHEVRRPPPETTTLKSHRATVHA